MWTMSKILAIVTLVVMETITFVVPDYLVISAHLGVGFIVLKYVCVILMASPSP